MHMGMKSKSHRLLRQIVFPLLVFVMIPMTLLNFAIFHLLNALRQEEYQRNLKQLESTGDYVSTILEESISVSRKIFFDNDFQRLAYVQADLKTEDYAKIRTVDAILKKYYHTSNNRFFSHHIYYTENNILISTDGSCHDLSYFYGRSYRLGDYSLEQINDLSTNANYNIEYCPEVSVMVNGATNDGFFYVTALNHPVEANQGKGMILSTFHMDALNDFFLTLNDHGGVSYITDRNGMLLSVVGDTSLPYALYLPNEISGYLPEEIYGPGYSASYVCLSEGINIYNVKPTSEIIRKTHVLTIIALLLNFATLLVCAFVMIPVSKKRLINLTRLFSMLGLSSDREHKNHYDRLNHAVAVLVDKNHSLCASLTRNIFLLRSIFWNKLIRGNYASESEMCQMAANADINLDADFFCLLIITYIQDVSIPDARIDRNAEKSAASAYHKQLFDFLETKTVHEGYVHSLSEHHLMITLRISRTNVDHYKQYIENLFLDLPTPPQGAQIRCVGSRLFDSIFAISNEYSYCCNVLLRYYEAFRSDQNLFVWSKDEYSQKDRLDFPKKLSEQLINSIRSGEIEKVNSCFKEIIVHNFGSEQFVTTSASNMLLIRFKIVMMDAYEKEMPFQLHKRFQEIDRLSYDTAKIARFAKLAEEMCSYYRNNLDQKTDMQRQKIISYIHGHYQSPTFSLTEVATHCGFSDSYFSILFRDIMHVSFSSYIERLKMEAADRLLLETNLKIDEIALKIGYSNGNAFRRAYKKYFSVSPSQRRKK